jgi:putative acetyltransferase
LAVRDDWQGIGAGIALMQAAVELADRWLNLMRLELEVYTDNQVGVRLYKKFGFAIEGTLHDFAFRDGQFVDAYAMARVRTRQPIA